MDVGKSGSRGYVPSTAGIRENAISTARRRGDMRGTVTE